MVSSCSILFTDFRTFFCFRSTTFPSAVRTSDQQLLVLHCNYKEDFIPKFDLVITFGSYWHKVNASECKIFLVTPYLTIFGSPKYACQIPNLVVLGIIGVFGAHNLIGDGVLNMIKWVTHCGYPWKMHFSHVDLVSKGPPSQKLWPNLSSSSLQCKTKKCWHSIWICSSGPRIFDTWGTLTISNNRSK